jgi:hypothetical protein
MMWRVAVGFCFMVGLVEHCYAQPVQLSDLDISVNRTADSKWCSGHQCSQTERDALNTDRISVGAPIVARFAEKLGIDVGGADYGFTTTLVRFFVVKPYDDIEGDALNGGDDAQWVVQTGGATQYYDGQEAYLKTVCGTIKNRLGSCSKVVKETLDLRALTICGLKVLADGKCVVDVDQPDLGATPVGVSYNSGLATTGFWTAKKQQAVPVGDALMLLHMTHKAHAANVACHCGLPGCDPNADVLGTHILYEATAFDESSRNFRRMQRFLGFVDSRWTKDEECRLFKKADEFHEAWMRAEEAGDGGLARRAMKGHAMVHMMINRKSGDRLKYRVPCGAVGVGFCPQMTAAQYVAGLP